MDESSYLRVAKTLNAHGIWTSWCSQFLKEAAFKVLGMEHLKRSLKRAGWKGEDLALHVDVDPGNGFAYGLVLVEDMTLGDKHERHLQQRVRDHVTKHHMDFVLEGKRTPCDTSSMVTH